MMTNQAEQQAATPVLEMPQSLTRDWVVRSGLAGARPTGPLTVDFRNTTQIDSAGAALLNVLNANYRRRSLAIAYVNVPRIVTDAINRSAPGRGQALPRPTNPPFIIGLGTIAVTAWGSVIQALSVLTEMLYWGTAGLLERRDFRKGVLLEQMFQLGYRAVFIVVTLGLLVGIVLAQQTAMQLKDFGAGIFLAQLITFSMIRELGPLLTAIILAGRSGSATTAEIATMVVGEEIDALKTMGLNPIQFVVAPKFWAITITMPLLSILTTAAGIMGGYLVSLLYLDIPSSLFWGEVAKLRLFNHFVVGFVKSVVYSWIIIWIGAFYGLKVRGGAEAVGRETTASVVTCLFTIIIADAVFSFVFLNF